MSSSGVSASEEVTSSLSDADSHASDVSSTRYTSRDKVIQHGLNLRLLISQKVPRDRIASSICDYIDATLSDENNDWYGSLPFKCCTSTDASVISRDIVQYVGGKKLNKNKPTFHFCPTTYPIRGGFSGEGFQLLVKDLQRLSIKKGGFTLIRTGNRSYLGNPNGTYRLSCHRCQLYRGNVHDRSNMDFRNVSFSNDRRNNRDKNTTSNMCRRTVTMRPFHVSKRCPYFIILNYNDQGFYVMNGLGNPVHKHHPKYINGSHFIPPRLIEDTQLELINDLCKADASLGVIRNTIHMKTGAIYSRANLFHLRGLCDILSGIQIKEQKYSSTEILIQFFEENNYEYTMLTHCALMDQIIHQRMIYPFVSSQNNTVTFPTSEHDDANCFVHQRRDSLQVAGNQQLMMALAWIVPQEARMFKFFPSVIFVDATMDTNNEGRPLLSMVGKDTCGKTFTILRVFLPNQQLWIFRWVFCILLPQLYGNHILQQINVVITDGDAQENSQLDNAIDKFFPHAQRFRCGWHIVNRSWMKRIEGPKSFPSEMQVFYEKMKDISHSWIYSFMKGTYCETREEYIVSKNLFKRFLTTPSLHVGARKILVTNIITWFKSYVEVHEDHYSYYKKSNSLCFGEYSNSVVEGVHNGMKHSSAPILPSHSLHRAVAILSKNATRKEEIRKKRSIG